jgi:hypothetical protein
MAVFTEETKLGVIEILANGRVQFREETQVYKDGKPFGSPEYHRSAIDVGYLDEFDELVLYPLSSIEAQTLGLNTTLDLEKILEGVRTPEVQAAWKQTLIEEREIQLNKERAQASAREEQERLQAEAKASENDRIAHAVAEAMRKQK